MPRKIILLTLLSSRKKLWITGAIALDITDC